MLLRAMMMILLMGFGKAQAQDTSAVDSRLDSASGASELVDAMPAMRLKALKASPEGFLEDAAVVIFAAGRDGRLDAAGLDTYIALRRAEVRARRMGQFLGADLDNDGTIGRDEASLFAGSLGARRRGEVYWMFDLADRDEDGSVTMQELRIHAETKAVQALDDADAAGLRSLMLFDRNTDGAVTMDEMVSAVSALSKTESAD